MATKAGTKTHPPTVSVGQGGPPETQLAVDLRARRDKAGAQLAELRARRRLAKEGPDREKVDREVGEKAAEVARLSDQIRSEESRK